MQISQQFKTISHSCHHDMVKGSEKYIYYEYLQ